MRALLAIPLLVILVAFALSNPQPVRLGLWPTDIQLEVPLSIAILVAAFLFFLVGAFMTWTTAVAMRARAKSAERHVRLLESQVNAMRARTTAVPMLPPA